MKVDTAVSCESQVTTILVKGDFRATSLWCKKPNLAMRQRCRLKLAVIRSLQDFQMHS